jgi:hypothetical protein
MIAIMKRAERKVELPLALTTTPAFEEQSIMAERDSISATEEKPVEYRDVPGAPGYRVGDDGSIWCNRKWGFRHDTGWRRLKCTPIKNGYPYFSIGKGNSRGSRRLVSRTVLEAFAGPCPPGMEACHFPDPSPLNNRLSNLRWGTPKENNGDKKIHGTQPIGERVYGSVITTALAVQLRNEYARGSMTAADLARTHGLNHTTVRQVINGRNWKYAGGPIATGSLRHRQHSKSRKIA